MSSVLTIGLLAGTTLLLGMLLGFIGAGGAGLTVALLTVIFRLPVHDAIGTALASMCFVTITGAVSHYREGNVAMEAGVIAGIGGVLGAVVGARIGQGIPEAELQIAAGLGLWFLAALMWIRLRMAPKLSVAAQTTPEPAPKRRTLASLGLGLTGGTASAFLGVGMAPFLQLGFLSLLKLPLRQTVGTTMLTLVFISFSGATALAFYGDVSVPHLVGVTLGLGSGSYFGARFTRRARSGVLRFAVVATPFVAGAVLLFA
jgi:uncharacterized membrane protein YfcA